MARGELNCATAAAAESTGVTDDRRAATSPAAAHEGSEHPRARHLIAAVTTVRVSTVATVSATATEGAPSAAAASGTALLRLATKSGRHPEAISVPHLRCPRVTARAGGRPVRGGVDGSIDLNVAIRHDRHWS
ncbi:MAG: hypothetical protein R3A78_05025 [Polyangiales bacterium]